MHDPAALGPLLTFVAAMIFVWILGAIVGAFYLGLRWLPRLARKGGRLESLFVDPPQ